MKILVVMGGLSSEREISIKSGENVFNKLQPIYKNVEKYVLNDFRDFYRKILDNHYDFVFIVLHGKNGEDGVIQTFLETLNIPFSFSNSVTSMIGMNKYLTNLVIEKFIKENNIVNLFIPNTVYVKKEEYEKRGIDFVLEKMKQHFLYPPLIVKPNFSGSSVGLSIIENIKDLEKSLEKALEKSFKEDPQISLIQEYIEGREITVGVIKKDDETMPLEPCELELKESKLFDYENKYTKKINHIIPPNLEETALEYLKNISKRIFEYMGFKDAVRIDYRITKENKLYFLEVNTIPGFTEVSLLPQEAEKTGIKFEELLKIIIENNIRKLQIERS